MEDALKPINKDGETILEVECGRNKAHLYLGRLCQGSKGTCILFRESWLTPNEFQYVSGRQPAKDWKRSIRHEGKSLKLLLNKGLVKVHPPTCDCSNCRLTPPKRKGRQAKKGTPVAEQNNTDDASKPDSAENNNSNNMVREESEKLHEDVTMPSVDCLQNENVYQTNIVTKENDFESCMSDSVEEQPNSITETEQIDNGSIQMASSFVSQEHFDTADCCKEEVSREPNTKAECAQMQNNHSTSSDVTSLNTGDEPGSLPVSSKNRSIDSFEKFASQRMNVNSVVSSEDVHSSNKPKSNDEVPPTGNYIKDNISNQRNNSIADEAEVTTSTNIKMVEVSLLNEEQGDVSNENNKVDMLQAVMDNVETILLPNNHIKEEERESSLKANGIIDKPLHSQGYLDMEAKVLIGKSNDSYLEEPCLAITPELKEKEQHRNNKDPKRKLSKVIEHLRATKEKTMDMSLVYERSSEGIRLKDKNGLYPHFAKKSEETCKKLRSTTCNFPDDEMGLSNESSSFRSNTSRSLVPCTPNHSSVYMNIQRKSSRYRQKECENKASKAPNFSSLLPQSMAGHFLTPGINSRFMDQTYIDLMHGYNVALAEQNYREMRIGMLLQEQLTTVPYDIRNVPTYAQLFFDPGSVCSPFSHFEHSALTCTPYEHHPANGQLPRRRGFKRTSSSSGLSLPLSSTSVSNVDNGLDLTIKSTKYEP